MTEDVLEMGFLFAPEVEHDCSDYYDRVGQEDCYDCVIEGVLLENVEATKICQTEFVLSQSFMFS